jgi:hypothetical protein
MHRRMWRRVLARAVTFTRVHVLLHDDIKVHHQSCRPQRVRIQVQLVIASSRPEFLHVHLQFPILSFLISSTLFVLVSHYPQ